MMEQEKVIAVFITIQKVEECKDSKISGSGSGQQHEISSAGADDGGHAHGKVEFHSTAVDRNHRPVFRSTVYELDDKFRVSVKDVLMAVCDFVVQYNQSRPDVGGDWRDKIAIRLGSGMNVWLSGSRKTMGDIEPVFACGFPIALPVATIPVHKRDTQKDKGLLAAGENIDYYAIVSFPPHPVDSIPIQESSHKTACEECTKEAAILKSMLDGGYDVRNCFPYTFELLPQLLLQAQGSKKAHSKVKPFCAAEEYINGQLKENITDQFYSSVVPTKPSSSTLMEASELVDPFAHGIEAHLSNASSFRHRLGKEESTKLVIDLTPEQLRSLKDPASEKLDVAVKGAILASMSSGKTDSMKAGAVSVASLEEAQRVKAERKAMVEKALQLCFLSHTEAKDALCALVKLAAPCLIRVTNCGALLSSIADAYMSSKPVIRDLLTPVQNPARKSVVGYKVLPNWRDLLRDNISSLREAISANLKAVGPVDDKTHVAHAPQDSSQRFLGSNKVVAKKGEVDDVVRHDYRQPLQHEEEEVEQQAEGPWLGDDDGGDQEQETYGIMKSGHRRGNLGKRSHSSAANNNYTAGVTNSRPQQILAPASSLSPSVHLPPPPLPPPGCPLMVCIREGVEESAISAEDEEGKDSFSARPAAIAATEDRCVNIRDVVLKEGTLLLLQHPMHTKKLARQFNKDTVAEYSHKVESDDDAFFVGRLSMGDGIWSSKLRIPLLYFQVVPAVEDSNLTVDDEEFSPGV